LVNGGRTTPSNLDSNEKLQYRSRKERIDEKDHNPVDPHPEEPV
jgi:hypothetical protein